MIPHFSQKGVFSMYKLARLLLILGVFLSTFYPVFGAMPSAHAGQSLDYASIQTFFDDYLGTQMAANHVAGAAVSVVTDAQILFSKGYGYADVAQNIPVDPEKTVFILGSISKLFTWTAVMQLVEQGKLDLDADVNTYLDFHIPDTYPQPITLKNLMTHTSGFEETVYQFDAMKEDDLVPVRAWLVSH